MSQSGTRLAAIWKQGLVVEQQVTICELTYPPGWLGAVPTPVKICDHLVLFQRFGVWCGKAYSRPRRQSDVRYRVQDEATYQMVKGHWLKTVNVLAAAEATNTRFTAIARLLIVRS